MSPVSFRNRVTVVLIAVFVTAVNFISMPAEFYPGDAYAIKREAINLVRNGELGFRKSESSELGGFIKSEDQYYILNKSTDTYHNRWGPFNLAIFVLPELANLGKKATLIKGEPSADASVVLAHNIFNILLSVILAVFLYKTASLHTHRNYLRVFMVLSILYASFVWNYMRAQTYEIIHLTLFAGFFYYYVVFLRAFDGIRNFTSYRSYYFYNLFLAALCLSKSFFFFLYPFLFFAICFKLMEAGGEKKIGNLWRQKSNLFRIILPGVLTLAVFLLLSYLFYGELFLGYLSNKPHAGIIAYSYRYIPQRLYDYFISENRSLFVHMPLLILGLIGFPWYFRRHRYEAAFLMGSFLFAIVFFSFCYTVGEWCYGPRFFVFLLPALCLPLAYLVEYFIRSEKRLAMTAVTAAVLLVSALTVRAQMEVNSRAFHLRYELEDQLKLVINLSPGLQHYFAHANFAVIAHDTNIFMSGGNTGYLARALSRYQVPGQNKGALLIFLRKYLAPTFPENYFFKTVYGVDQK